MASRAARGSSPLARGLPLTPAYWRRRTRIIPARAGFTGPRLRPRRRRGDHPRSRGVYRRVPDGDQRGIGIIPARAGFTKTKREVVATEPWIIPARAGFTGAGRRAPGWRGDHPRSRGVYLVHARARAQGNGSSPLARGLLAPVPITRVQGRIIPARAGFTAGHEISVSVAGGSSPLARGLRSGLPEGGFLRGIIPARAGFTGRRQDRRGQRPDHPRSRGVYDDVFHSEDKAVGSSPLARGLHQTVMLPGIILGIIPARAGFTGCGS